VDDRAGSNVVAEPEFDGGSEMRRRASVRASVWASSLRVGLVAVVGLGASGLWWLAPPAGAVQTSQPTLVSAVPAADTPAVNDGVVYAIAQVGSQIILGGTFTSVSPANDPGTVYSLPDTFAFDSTTGTIDNTGFLPAVNGKVDTVIAGPRPGEVYISGAFTSVDGSAMRVALLDTTTGAVVSGWNPPAINGPIDRLVLADNRLFAGGRFTTVDSVVHRGLVALDPATGRLTSYVDLSFTGHHNYGTKCDPTTTTCANGTTGVTSMDINPAGTRMVVVGNFIDVSGRARDQIAMVDLGKSSATVDTHWATLAYTSPCFDYAFDSYIRDVQFSPDGSYFVVAATGGIGSNSDHTNSSCDTAARYGTSAAGSDVRPRWLDYTGEDTLSTLAITGSAVYVGGHERWLNNSLGDNVAAPGAVPRPGIAALSPLSGLPYTWNPGRNPRGAGAFALLATSTGLWVGSDSNYIGDKTYLRPKIAFFPLAGGEAPPAEPTPALPGRVYLVGATAPAATAAAKERLAFREFNGTSAGREIPLSTGISWGSVHGAFTVDGQVIYGGSDGFLYKRSFDGTTFGPQVKLDPYDDPTWDNVQTGSGQTYVGLPSTFLSEIPSVTSMFFLDGRLYYTMAGAPAMHWRWFEPESGVVGADEFRISGGMNVSDVAGAFLAGRRLYFSDLRNGKLWSVAWSRHRATGHRTLVNASTDWASRGLFLLSATTDPTATPTAAFTARCGTRPTCRFRATPWVDPDGGTVTYRWSFGDGAARSGRSTSVSHRYLTDGVHRVTLTVMDTAGAKATTSRSVTVKAHIDKVDFVGSVKAAGRGTSLAVRVPSGARAGDALLLFDSYASASAKATVPRGWKPVGRSRRNGLTTEVFDRVATKHQLKETVTARYSAAVDSSLILAVYRHAAAKPIEAAAVGYGRRTKTHTAPTLRALSTRSLVLGYWTATSHGAATWRPPHAIRKRAMIRGGAAPTVSALLADSAAGHRGRYALGSARTNRRANAAAQWAIALLPALR
jgi:hypothetical protein